jgi:hypothetical protein
MVFFGIPESQFVGLAACRLEAGDGIWHFAGMKNVFIVRRSSDQTIRIVGRALVFAPENFPRDEPTANAWLRSSLDFSSLPQVEQTISINYAKLLDLVSLSSDIVKIVRRPVTWSQRAEICETHVCAVCPNPVSGCWSKRSTTQKLLIIGGEWFCWVSCLGQAC